MEAKYLLSGHYSGEAVLRMIERKRERERERGQRRNSEVGRESVKASCCRRKT